MTGNAWKRLEKTTADRLGLRRNVRGGDWSQSLPDCEGERLVIECKYRKTLPEWLKAALEQAQGYAGADRFPAVVVKERGQRGAIVIMDLADFEAWFGRADVSRQEALSGNFQG